MKFHSSDVSRAFQNGEFLPYFQPIVELRTGELRGFEILARWKHPERGFVLPDTFISQAEEQGWIGDLTRELLRQAFAAATEHGLPSTCALAVNLSPLQLRDRTLPNTLQEVAAQTGLSADRVVLEITETALLDDLHEARRIVHDLKAIGCRLALDDFGTGYSGLSHLQALPFDELKVDSRFVISMTTNRESRKIVAAVVGLGQSLGLTTVAEGVETCEQAEMLVRLDCNLAQGWLYSKAVPAVDLPATIAAPRLAFCPSPLDRITGRVSYLSLDGLPSQRLAQLQAVYDGAPVGLAFIDKNLRYKNVNRRLANMNGRSMEEHLGATMPEIIPGIFPLVEPYVRRALAGEAIDGVEVTVALPGREHTQTLVASYEPALDEAGEVLGFCTAIMDITPLKLAEAQWRESQENFRQMLELLPQIPWVIDPEGRALDVSWRWLQLAGIGHEDWQGFGWLDALHPDDRQPTVDGIRSCLVNHQPICVKYRLRAKGEDWKWWLSRGSARLDAEGKVLCWYGSLEEIF